MTGRREQNASAGAAQQSAGTETRSVESKNANEAAQPWDVIIAGAGPGGSTAAALLAQGGMRVLVLEKESFPRFHIGESLLPAAELVETLLGISMDESVGIEKRGAHFVCEASGRTQAFDFAEALPGPRRSAWQVDRAAFDARLADRARELGATLRHGVRVRGIDVSGEAVRVEASCVGAMEAGTRDIQEGRDAKDARSAHPTPGETLTARYFLDATGQGRLLARHHRSATAYEDFGKAAAFTHFDDLSFEASQRIGEGNDIRIMMVEDGWAWVIPLPRQRLSVGLVSKRKGLGKQALDELLANSPLLRDLTEGATRGDTGVIGNYSYRNDKPFGARFGCIGDAACFLDPVFSSGVSMAMQSAALTCQALLPALRDQREGDAMVLQPVHDTLRKGYTTFAALIDRFYNTRFVDNMILGAPETGAYRAGVVSVLAGDVFRTDNPFADMLLRARGRNRRQAKSDAAATPPVANAWQVGTTTGTPRGRHPQSGPSVPTSSGDGRPRVDRP